MAGALQEYLDDPNFEQNRVEYKANKEAADRVSKSTVNGRKSNAGKHKASKIFHPRSQPILYYLASSISSNLSSLPSLPEVPIASTSQKVATSSQQQESKDIIDFFSAIEEEHPTTFNPQNSKYDARLPLSKITNFPTQHGPRTTRIESFRSDGKWTKLPATSNRVTTHWIYCTSTNGRTTTAQRVWQFPVTTAIYSSAIFILFIISANWISAAAASNDRVSTIASTKLPAAAAYRK